MMIYLRSARVRGLARCVLLSVFLLPAAGCDSNEGEADTIEGVWKSRGDDVFYLAFSAERLDFYDFMGDAFDEGEACYFVYRFPIVRVEDHTYVLNDSDLPESGFARVRLEAAGTVLTLSFTDEDSGTTLSQQMDRSDLSVGELTPFCAGEEEKSAASLQHNQPSVLRW